MFWNKQIKSQIYSLDEDVRKTSKLFHFLTLHFRTEILVGQSLNIIHGGTSVGGGVTFNGRWGHGGNRDSEELVKGWAGRNVAEWVQVPPMRTGFSKVYEESQWTLVAGKTVGSWEALYLVPTEVIEGVLGPLELYHCVGAGNQTLVLCKGSKMHHLYSQFSNVNEHLSCLQSAENAWAPAQRFLSNLVWGRAWVLVF